MVLNQVNIRWLRAGSKEDCKIMNSIELQTIFYEYQNKSAINIYYPTFQGKSTTKMYSHNVDNLLVI